MTTSMSNQKKLLDLNVMMRAKSQKVQVNSDSRIQSCKVRNAVCETENGYNLINYLH